MQPSQRRRLESLVADGALLVGALSMHSGQLTQAGAYLGTAESLAEQAGNMVVLAQVYAQHVLLSYYSESPRSVESSAQDRITRLEQADQLAGRYAPPVMQMAISAWLAEDKAAAKDGHDADMALEHRH
jgi:hypothetical protein